MPKELFTQIGEEVQTFCETIRRTCPFGDPNAETGTRATFDMDVAAFGQLAMHWARLQRLFSFDGMPRPFDSDNSAVVYQLGGDQRQTYALATIWRHLSRSELTFSGSVVEFGRRSELTNEADDVVQFERRRMSPGQLPTIAPVWLDAMEVAATELLVDSDSEVAIQADAADESSEAAEVLTIPKSCVDEDTIRINEIAQGTGSAEDRMRAIVDVDRRAMGWNSERWGKLLSVKSPAIRQTDLWIEWQRQKKADD